MKRANLSTETIVSIILAIALLTFAMYFSGHEFQKAQELVGDEIDQQFFSQAQDKIYNTFETENTALALSNNILNVKPGEIKMIFVGIKNIDSTQKNFSLDIDETWISYFKDSKIMPPGEIFLYIVEIKVPETEYGNKVYDVVLNIDDKKVTKQLYLNIK